MQSRSSIRLQVSRRRSLMCEAARLGHSTVTTNSTEQRHEPLGAAQAGHLLAAFEHVQT